MFILIVIYLFSRLASASALSNDDKPDFKVDPGSGLHTAKPVEEQLDPLSRLKFPLSDAFEIRQRIWNKVSFCDKCHAPGYSSANGYLPLLQGQNREYLYATIKSFQKYPQSRHPFPEYSAALSNDEVIDISLYYWIQQSLSDLKLMRFDMQQRQPPAQDVSIVRCLDCHAADGNGANLIPDLSGQSVNYLSYRIREISSGTSRIHLDSDAPVSCEIGPVTIPQSRQMAKKLSMVLDITRLSRGKSVYQNNCQHCHENPASSAPVLNTEFDWMEKLSSGLSRYVDVTSRHTHRFDETLHQDLSRNQWMDALSYLINQSSKVRK